MTPEDHRTDPCCWHIKRQPVVRRASVSIPGPQTEVTRAQGTGSLQLGDVVDVGGALAGLTEDRARPDRPCRSTTTAIIDFSPRGPRWYKRRGRGPGHAAEKDGQLRPTSSSRASTQVGTAPRRWSTRRALAERDGKRVLRQDSLMRAVLRKLNRTVTCSPARWEMHRVLNAFT